MDAGKTDLSVVLPPAPDLALRDTALTDAVNAAWKSRCSKLSADDQKRFLSYACDGLPNYLAKLEAAVLEYRESSILWNVAEWFEPIYKAIELFTPAASVAVQAYPNPGSLVLGGIVGIMQVTGRIVTYQKLTVEMLSKMGRKARVFLEYERDIYKDDKAVQSALIKVYGDILAFCQKAFRFMDKNGHRLAKVKGVGLILFRDYESHFEAEIKDFENHVEEVESFAFLRDKKRLEELQKNQELMVAEYREHFQRGTYREDLLTRLWRRDQDLREQENQRERERSKNRMLEWLSPSVSFGRIYESKCREHLAGTGSWLLNSAAYQSWKSGDSSDLLWVKGKPGCGKSVLAALVITYLRLELVGHTPDEALAYAFCKKEEESLQNPSSILGALATQLIQQQLDVSSVLESEYKISQRGETPGPSTVFKIMKSAVSHFKKVFLVVDALDEYEHTENLVSDLLELLRKDMGPPLKIIVFSRPDFVLEQSLDSFRQIHPTSENGDDLKAYVEYKFPDEGQTNSKIRDQCIAKAEGMFLWVKLLHEKFKKSPLNPKQKLDRIQEIPAGLRSMYDHMLKDLWEQEEDVRSTAFLVLTWVIHARRPLSQEEMLEAVADYSEANSVRDAFKITHAEHLVIICRNLVVIDKNGRFLLCHQSVQGHLEDTTHAVTCAQKEFLRLQTDADIRLARICLRYLSLNDFECGPARSVGRLRALVKKYPFLEYAAGFWGSHVPEKISEEFRDDILVFVRSQPRRELSMQITLYDPADDSNLWTHPNTSNPLHILAIFGLEDIAENLPASISLSLDGDGAGQSPLTYALLRRHHKMTVWLIKQPQTCSHLVLTQGHKVSAIHLGAVMGWSDVIVSLVSEEGALINSKADRGGSTPLARACQVGEKDAVLTLIKGGANVDEKDGFGDSPLITATVHRHPEIVKILLEYDADPHASDADGVTPLHFAAQTEDVEIVEALLSKGANPMSEAPDAACQTPIHVAAERQNSEKVLRALHKKHPHLEKKTADGRTALHCAAWYGAFRAASVLLELGCPKDEVDIDGETALFIAANQGALETVKVLVDGGCDVTLPNSSGRTALHAAARSGKFSIVRYILNSQRMDRWHTLLSKQGDNAETPLHDAIHGGNPEIVKFLLTAGAEATSPGILKASPLHYIAHYGSNAMARLILAKTKNANPRDENDDTPLHFAARARQHDFIVQFFQDCSELGISIEIDALNRWKKNALLTALVEGCEEAAKFLIDKGSTSFPGEDGNYPIHMAAWFGYDALVEVLRNQEGAKSKGYYGRTPLLCAALRGHFNCVKLLTSDRDILDTPDDNEGTPCRVALGNKHFKVANFLLDLKADHNTHDSGGNSLMHIAAFVGDLEIIDRLLKLGCDPCQANKYGDTSFHVAVREDKIKALDKFFAAGFNAVTVPNYLGTTCISFAAMQGNMTMMRKLEEYGAKLSDRTLLGWTCAHAAASNGHWEILAYLGDRGERLDVEDVDGTTPLLSASGHGHYETVKYLLQTQSGAVNQLNEWTKVSPLTDAAARGFPLTVKSLLAAGADPYHRDAYGMSALDYAALHKPSLREMHKAGFFYDSEGLSCRPNMLRETITRCSRALLDSPMEPSVVQLCSRLEHLICLGYALMYMEDFDAAKTCAFDIFWPPALTLVSANFVCDICGSDRFSGSKYMCKSCRRSAEICKECYEDYKTAGCKIPEALAEIMELEIQMLPVRAALPRNLSLLEVSECLYYFQVGAIWCSDMLEKYEAWEQEYNSTDKYRELPRPGQTVLKLVRNVQRWTSKYISVGINENDLDDLSTWCAEYNTHQGKYRAGQEIRGFPCENHEYLEIDVGEREKVKSEGIHLDSATGRVSRSFLEHIQQKYTDHQDSIVHETLRNGPTELAEFRTNNASSHVHGARKQSQTETVSQRRPQGFRRAFTTVLKSPKKLTRDDTSLSAGKSMRGPAPENGSRKIHQTRRAETMPLSLIQSTNLHTQDIVAELKDPKVISHVQNQLEAKAKGDAVDLNVSGGTRPVMKKTISIAFAAERSTVREKSTQVNGGSAEADVFPNTPPTAVEENMLSLTLSSEPEEIPGLESTNSPNVPEPAIAVREKDIEDDNEDEDVVMERTLKVAYQLYDEGDADGVDGWLLALNVTDRMIPGFIEAYMRIKREMFEEKLAEDDEDDGDTPTDATKDTRRSQSPNETFRHKSDDED